MFSFPLKTRKNTNFSNKLKTKTKTKTKFKSKDKRTYIKQKGGEVQTFELDINARLAFFPDPLNLVTDIFPVIQTLYREKYLYLQRSAKAGSGSSRHVSSAGAGRKSNLLKHMPKSGAKKPSLELDYQDTHLDNLTNFYQRKSEIMSSMLDEMTIRTDQINKFKSESCLIYVSNHGFVNISFESAMYSIVPPNTIICFSSPLDHTIRVNETEFMSLDNEIKTITEEKYLSLFQYGIKLKKHQLGTHSNYDPDLEILNYNCLADSNWYYPGDLYPNLTLGAGPSDLGSDFFQGTEFIFYNKPDDKTVSFYNDPTYKSNVELEQHIIANKKSVYYRLNELVEYDIPIVQPKYKLFLISSCRPIEYSNPTNVNNVLSLDLFMYHINHNTIQEISPPSPAAVKTGSFNIFQAKCSTETYLNYYISKFYTGKDDIFQDRNSNKFSKLPVIMDIYNKIIDKKEIETIEYNYLANLPFKILTSVFRKIQQYYFSRGPGESAGDFFKQFIFQTLHVLTYRQKKYLEYLLCLKSQDRESVSSAKLGELENLEELVFFLNMNAIGPSFFLADQIKYYHTDVGALQSQEAYSYSTTLSNALPSCITFYSNLDLSIIGSSIETVILKISDYPSITNTIGSLDNVIKVVMEGTDIPIETPVENMIDDLVAKFPNLAELVLINLNLDTESAFIKIKQPQPKLVTLKLENTNLVIHGLNNLIALQNLDFCRLKGNDMLILNLCKKLQNLKILDCLELKNIIILSCRKIECFEIRNCELVTTFNISASVNILILNEINWHKGVEMDTFNVSQIKSNYSHLSLDTLFALLENKKRRLVGKKPVLHLELNYSYIYLDYRNPKFLTEFHQSLGKVKNTIQIAYSLLANNSGETELIKVDSNYIQYYNLSKKKTLHITEDNLIDEGINPKILKCIRGFS